MKAKEVGDKLLPAFNTPTGIPWAMVNFARYDLMNKAEIIMLLSALLCFTWSWICTVLSTYNTVLPSTSEPQVLYLKPVFLCGLSLFILALLLQ